jgi:DNA-binding MarR family transcriptional regulator
VSEVGWTFLSNHGHVLVALSRNPKLRIRDLAEQIGITERSVRSIIVDLTEAGYLEVSKAGRQNSYRVLAEKNFRHPAESKFQVKQLLNIFRAK